MKVTMKETRRGSEDGYSVRCYEQGETYDLADGLARAFLRDGSATRAGGCLMSEELKRLFAEKEAAKSVWEATLSVNVSGMSVDERIAADIATQKALDAYWSASSAYNNAVSKEARS